MGVAALLPQLSAADELLPWLERSNGVYSVHEAAAAGDMYALKGATNDRTTINMPDELGRTALDIAAERGFADGVRHLLAEGAMPSSRTMAYATSQEIISMLHRAYAARQRELQLCEAVASKNVPEVRKLLAMGVSPNALSHDHQMSVLMQAVYRNQIWMVRVLLENGADVNYVNTQSKSVLHIAAAVSDAQVVQALLRAGANPLAKGNNGATPLHDAVWEKNVEAVRALLPAYKNQNFNPDGERNGRPLIMAISNRNLPIVELFIEAGTDLRDSCFATMPPLAAAVATGDEKIARALLRAGADPDARDARGKSARDYATIKMPNLFK